MTLFLDSLSRLIFFPLELLAAVIVFAYPLERRKKGLIRMAVSLAFAAALFSAGCLYAAVRISPSREEQMMSPQVIIVSSLTWCGLVFLLMIFLILLGFSVTVREAVYCASCAYLSEHIAYCVRILLGSFLPGLPIGTGLPLYYISLILVYFLIWRLFVRNMVMDRHYAASAVDSFGLTLAALIIVLVLSAAASQYGFVLIHSIYGLLSCLFLLVSQVRQQKRMSLQKELDLQKQLWRQQKAQYEISKETIEIINRKCHDLKHQVAALKLIHDPVQQNRVIDDLQDAVMIYDSILQTGNDILDTVLTEKSLLCSRHHIVLTCMADGSALSFMDAVDLYTLFGNAMDNAIEASVRLPEEERMIDVQVRKKAGQVLISVTNRCAGQVVLEDGLPRTSKEDTDYHGFGLRSIQAVAEKYEGLMTLDPREGLFILRVMIPDPS